MAKLISKTYGEALFELAVEENAVDTFLEEITFLTTVLKENPDLGKLMNHPKISKNEKKQVIETIFTGQISREILGFLTLIVTKDRYKEIDDILLYFLDRVKELKGIGVAYVTTAIVLSGEQKSKIEKKILETSSFKQMEMHYTVDTALIGGMVIRIGDRVVDSSIKTKIANLERQLLKIQLA